MSTESPSSEEIEAAAALAALPECGGEHLSSTGLRCQATSQQARLVALNAAGTIPLNTEAQFQASMRYAALKAENMSMKEETNKVNPSA